MKLRVFILCIIIACSPLKGASSSSSSSSSSTPINPLATLTKAITQALPFTHSGTHPRLAQLIAAYAHVNTLNITHDIHDWIENDSTNIDSVGIRDFGSGEYRNTPVSITKPSSPDGRFPIVGFHEDGIDLAIHLFNTQFNSPECFFNDNACYVTYSFNYCTQTLTPHHTYPLGKVDEVDVDPAGTTIFTYQGDTSLQIPTERPQIAIPQADGSILHVWVPDHNPGTGGTQIEYYLETPISCSSN